MAKDETTDLTPFAYLGTAAILYLGIVKPIFNTLGITDSAEVKAQKEENTKAENINGWDPNFYKTYKATTKRLLPDPAVTALAKIISNAWGVLYDNEDEIFGAFRQLGNLLQLSQLCDKYFQLYQQDLLSRLKNPWYYGNNGLTEDEFNVVAKIVNRLPVN